MTDENNSNLLPEEISSNGQRRFSQENGSGDHHHHQTREHPKYSLEHLLSPLHIQSMDNQSDEQNSFDQSNLHENEDSILTDNQSTFHLHHHDKPEELKAQRDLDEEEIPPAELPPVDETPINDDSPHSTTDTETHLTDDRPLTDLEKPYEHHHDDDDEKVNSPIDLSLNENSIDINQTNYSLTEMEYSREMNPISLPDLVTETFEEKVEEFIPPSIELDKPLFEELSPKITNHLSEEILPPLPSTSIAFEQTNDKDEQQLLSSTSQSIRTEPVDVLGNKTLFKQVIVEGVPNTRPTRSTLATISYRLSLVDTLTSNVRLIENIINESFYLSENDIIQAIDICIQMMNRGEHALIDSDIRHCYGELGYEDKQIPSNNSSYRMQIELELHDWISPPDIQFLSIDQRLFWGNKKREMGNFHYRRQDYSTALQCYRGALRFLETENNPLRQQSSNDNDQSILIDRSIQVLNNIAQVNLLLNKYEACLNAVNNVLQHDPKNVKALFRQGKALFELGKYDQAIQPLKLFTQIQRTNPSSGNDYDKVNEMIVSCENKLANYQKNEKEIYRRMFQTTTTDQPRQTIHKPQNDQSNSNWWLYLGLGSTAALAALGLLTWMKYRQTS